MRRTAALLLLPPLFAALAVVAHPGAGNAALSRHAAEFLVRDCVARFGHERVRACEAVGASTIRPGVNPTTATCRAAAQRKEIPPDVARRLCGYYFQDN